MAVKTMRKETGTGQYNAGWHELTITDATDGTWTNRKNEEVRTIDLKFKDYPESMHHRVFESRNKETKEEFAISNLFRYACAGIISVLNDPTGRNPVIQYDDDVSNLVNTRVNAFFVKEKSTTSDKEYSRVFALTPVVQVTEHITWTEDAVARIKASVEKRHKTTTENVVTNTVVTTNVGTTTTEVPF